MYDGGMTLRWPARADYDMIMAIHRPYDRWGRHRLASTNTSSNTDNIDSTFGFYTPDYLRSGFTEQGKTHHPRRVLGAQVLSSRSALPRAVG